MATGAQDRGPPGHGGLFESLKTLAATLLAMGRTRLELLSTELEEELAWLGAMLTWTLVGLFCAGLGIVLATLLIVALFWDTNRILVLVILVLLFFLGALSAWRIVANLAKAKPRLFSASLAELSKDHEQLMSSDE